MALRTSVTFTSLSGSAPLSPFALIVEVIGIDGHGAVAVVPPGDVPAAARCRVKCRWIIRNAVRHADVQAVLQNVEHGPGSVHEAPFLQTGSRQRLGVCHVSVHGRSQVGSIALIANVERVGVGEPKPERKRGGGAGGCVGEARQNRYWYGCELSAVPVGRVP